MKAQNILLLSNNSELYDVTKESLRSIHVSIYAIDSRQLMLKVYQYRAQLLIVDLDEYKDYIFETIKSIQAYEYIPVIYVSSSDITSRINMEVEQNVLLDLSSLRTNLPYVVKQSILFKSKYDSTTRSYTAIDSINSITDKVINSFIDSKFSNYEEMVQKVLTDTFATNDEMQNVPSAILVTVQERSGNITKIYSYANDGTFECEDIFLFDGKSPYKNIRVKDEFYYNFANEELADIEDYYNMLTPDLLEKLPQINNITGYSTSSTTMLGINYQMNVTSVDADIIKALCVGLNLINNINSKINEVQSAVVYTANALARAAEVNDDDTGYHIKRVNEYSKFIAEKLMLDRAFVNTIYFSAQMHDVGKIHVPKQIICKKEKLSDEEFETIKQHTIFGGLIVGDSPYLEMAKEIAINHHEKFDGSGYPHGKSSEEIPLSARIVMLADIYDALRSSRSYKPAFSHQDTYQIIVCGDGRVMPEHFDPTILEVFINFHEQFDLIYNTYS